VGYERNKSKTKIREREIKEGDRNTRYFHIVANRRRRKTTIHVLDGPDGPMHNTAEMLQIATDYIKNLFKYEHRHEIDFGDNFFLDTDKISSADNEKLEALFSEGEIRKAIAESYSEGAPRPDGLSFLFYQNFWYLVKDDILEMFKSFHEGSLDLYRINFAPSP